MALGAQAAEVRWLVLRPDCARCSRESRSVFDAAADEIRQALAL